MALIILYLQPQILILTLPMALLLSTLLTYGRMNVDNELVILRSSGMSFRAIARPVLYLGLFSFTAGIAMSFSLGPAGAVLLREKVTEVLTKRAALSIEEGIFNTAFKDIVILVKEKPAPDRLLGIFVIDERKKDERIIIMAKEAKIIQQSDLIGFLLLDGHAYLSKKGKMTEISFGKYHFTLTPSVEPSHRKTSEMTPAELLSAADDTTQDTVKFLLEFFRRISMPAVCLILIVLGPSLSLMAGKSGRLGGLTVGLSVFVVYYTILVYGENLSRSGKIPLYIGAWTAFSLLLLISLFLFERMNKR
jgi:lipopolysaccharide export system permease protein